MPHLLAIIRRLAPFTTAALLLALGCLGWEFLSRRAAERHAEERLREKQAAASRGFETDPGGGVRILQFYAAPAVLREGETAILCYGVSNAASVRIEPGVEPASPSPNRCLAVSPDETTRYTLTAAGADGKTVSASFILDVAPDPDTQPKVLYFVKGRKQKDGDRTIHTLCFETRNAQEVSIEPRAFPPGPLLRGCFYVVPPATTTYKLTATDAKGRKAQRELIAEVP